MNHAERVKALVARIFEDGFRVNSGPLSADREAAFAAIDAMQSALRRAVADRDKYMGLWAALSQDEGKAERAIAELGAKLAATEQGLLKWIALHAAVAHVADNLQSREAARDAEIKRLTACLKKANESTEHFEREWYLRGDEIDRLHVALEER
jgi:hypothetical protein